MGGPNGQMSLKHEDYTDAAITPEGEAQAQAAQSWLQEKAVELVVASPLQRTIQTALLAVPEPPGGVIVAHEGVREVMFGPACTNGTGNASTRHSVTHKQEQFGRMVDFSAVDHDQDELWQGASAQESTEEVHARALGFLDWLDDRDEKVVAVFCHGYFMHSLFNRRHVRDAFQVSEEDMDAVVIKKVPNCCCHEVVLTRAAPKA